MLKKFLLIALFLASSLLGSTISIAVAANVSYAIKPLIKEFNKHYPNTKVRVTLGSSGKLTAQIKHGAPYGLFMSANMNYPDALYLDKLAITKPRIYAQGALAYLSTKKRDLSQGINLTKDSSIKKIAVANPKTAPYGIATKEALLNAGIYEEIKSKFIYGESVAQTVSYAMVAADMGFIAKSALFSPNMKKYKEGVNWQDVDSTLYTPIDQGVVILKNATTNSEIKSFYDFLFTKSAQTILQKFGYKIP